MTEATLERGDKTSTPDAGSRRYGWLLGREFILIGGLFIAYRFVRALVKDEFGVAFRNADRVIDWERAVGIFNEVTLQSGILGSDAVVWFLNRYYFFGHFAGAAIFMVWIYTRHYERYGRVRRVLVLITMSALAVHVAFPLAPPRWFPDLGFVDTLQTYGPRVYDSETVAATANQIAAMPSLHVAWALCIAWAVIIASPHRWRWLIVAHPILMSFAVVLTANHWWLDVLAAGALVALAVRIDAPVQRWLESRERRGSGPDGGYGNEPGADDPEPDSQIDLVTVG